MSDMSVHEVLTRAYNILEQRGWCGGAMAQGDGKVCLLGALDAAAGGDPADFRVWPRFKVPGVRRDAAAALRCPAAPESVVRQFTHYDPTVDDVFVWNDRQCNPAPVKQRLLEAIAATAPPPPDPGLPDLTEDREVTCV